MLVRDTSTARSFHTLSKKPSVAKIRTLDPRVHPMIKQISPSFHYTIPKSPYFHYPDKSVSNERVRRIPGTDLRDVLVAACGQITIVCTTEARWWHTDQLVRTVEIMPVSSAPTGEEGFKLNFLL